MKLGSKCTIPKRYVIVAMVFVGYANIFYLHSNLGMAVVEMTTVRNITDQNGSTVQRADFEWSPHEKSMILSSFSYGRLLSPIGGVLSGKFGGSTIYSAGILVTSLVTFFSPIFLQVNFYLFFVTNLILGAFETFSYASITEIFSRWAPPEERAKFVSFSLIGANFGSGISFIISGWILSTWNWQVLFYASGAASFVWFLIWIFVVKNDPSQDTRMSPEERKYIQDKVNCAYSNEKIVYPWKKILLCVPFWMACLVKFGIGCEYTFTYIYVPQYIKDTNNIDIKRIGYISTIPQVSTVIAAPFTGYISDYLRSHKLISVTKIHKLYIGIGMLMSTIAFVCVVSWSSLTIRIIAISMVQFFSTFAATSVLVVFLDLTPKYASFLNSMANVFFTSSGIVIPTLVGFIVTSHSTEQWNICFIILSCMHLVIGLLYLIFGSGKERSWANYSPSSNEIKEQSLEDTR